MGLNIGGQVEKINGKEISYKNFVDRYLRKNQPVVLTGLMDDWRACKDWVSPDGTPNLHFFSTHFGNSTVQVAECGKREFTDQKRVEMSVSDFITNWLEVSSKNSTTLLTHQDNDKSLLYLKDWHFVKEYPEYVAYTTPLFFHDDWLNLYLNCYRMHTDPDTYHEKNEISCSDYRFVYMGAKGTWTPLHADVFRSYSWSANVCGKKQWHFLSPSQCHLVFDRNMKSSVYDIFDDVSETKFPGFKKAIWMECTQDQNEIIFVPSGWYHQVHNMTATSDCSLPHHYLDFMATIYAAGETSDEDDDRDWLLSNNEFSVKLYYIELAKKLATKEVDDNQEDTISINHNWFNAHNLSWVWRLLFKDYNEAKEYIEDIRDISDDFEGLCQRNLAANTGMNFSDFFIFITRLCFASLAQLYLNEKNNQRLMEGLSPRTQHVIANLISIKEVSIRMKLVEALNENTRSLLDLREALKGTPFEDLCKDLERTYQTIYEQPKQCSETLRVNFELEFTEAMLLSKVCSSEDVIKLINSALAHLSINSCAASLGFVCKFDELEISDIL